EDGKRLIVAESAGAQLSVFDVGPDGALSNGRIFAQLPEGHYPDGICLDSEGGVWVACVLGPGVIRIEEGGAVTHRVLIGDGRFPYACVLGGRDRRTLYVCTAEKFDLVHLRANRTARIDAIDVPFRGAGRP